MAKVSPQNKNQGDASSMDESLRLRLLEIIPTFPTDQLPMDMGQFFQSHMLGGSSCVDDEELDCHTSSYRTLSKWLSAMEQEGLVLLKKVRGKKKAWTKKVVAVGPVQVQLFKSHGHKTETTTSPESFLSAANLAMLPSEQQQESTLNAYQDQQHPSQHDHNDDDSSVDDHIADAMSLATTTNSIATTEYSINLTVHSKMRQHQRGIENRDLQKAIKHGKIINRYRNGSKLIQGENGVTAVVTGGHKHTVITTWRTDGELGGLSRHWGGDDAHPNGGMLEEKMLVPSVVVKMLSSFMPLHKYKRMGQWAPLNEMDVHSACQDYFSGQKRGHGDGQLRKIAYLVATKQDEWMMAQHHEFSWAFQRVSLFCDIIDHLKLGEEKDENGNFRPRNEVEILDLFHQCGSQQFWDKFQLTSDKNQHLKYKIKEYLSGENEAVRQIHHSDWQVAPFLLKQNMEIAEDADELTDLIMQLSTVCHCVDNEWRDGVPPIVTISESFDRYAKSKKGAWKAGDVAMKHHKRRKNIMIIGLKEAKTKDTVNKLRRIAGCPCSTGTLDSEHWNSIHGTDLDPLAEVGSRTITLHLAEGCRTLATVMQVLAEIVPEEYRRYVAEVLEEPLQPSPAPLDSVVEGDDEGTDIYQETIQESTRIALTDIYSRYAPDKVRNIPHLLEKYAGKEGKLLKVVEKKYALPAPVAPAARPRAVPAVTQQDVSEAPLPASEPPKTAPTCQDDFSAFL